MKYIPLESLDLSLDPSETVQSSQRTHWQGDGDIATARARHKHLKARPKPSSKPSATLTPLRYIRAQYRCIVHPDLPLKFYSAGSIPWSALLRVVMPPVDCPICISTASVPRMLECGHVMCLPCFHRFLKHSEDPFCPICGDYFSGSTLPVSFMAADPAFMPQRGHETVLTLMSKPAGLPPAPTSEGEITGKPKPESLLFSRVVCATLSYLRQELKQEREILEKEQQEALELYGDDEGYPQALDGVRKALQAKLGPLDIKERPDQQGTTNSNSAPNAYFYQTAFESPTTFILSQLDVSVLKSAFGQFDQFPSTMVAKVENIIYTSFDNDSGLRKRFKYLNHLPDNAPIALLECDWRGVLPDEALGKYKSQLTSRRKNTNDKNRREEQERVRFQAEQDALFRIAARDDPPIQESIAQIDMGSLPTLGSSAPQKVEPKVWRKNEADLQQVQQLIDAAKKSGRKGRQNRLVIWE